MPASDKGAVRRLAQARQLAQQHQPARSHPLNGKLRDVVKQRAETMKVERSQYHRTQWSMTRETMIERLKAHHPEKSSHHR
jgi:hypothetical protein